MKPIVLPLALLLLSLSSAPAQEGLEKLRASFATLQQEAFAPQDSIDAKYEAQLDAMAKKAQDDANLDLVLQVREQKARNLSRAVSVAPAPIKDSQLRKLREVYDTQSAKLRQDRNKFLERINAGYLRDLSKYRDSSTKEGRIDDAVKADAEIKLIEKEIADEKATANSAASSKSEPDSKDLAAQITGEWQYSYNGRAYRRIYLSDGRIELWLDGSRDGSYLSDLRWKAEKRGIVNGAWVYKGEKEIARLKLSKAGLSLEDSGNVMSKVTPDKLWKK